MFYRTNLGIILVMMQVSKKIPFDNPDVLLGVRLLYVFSNLIILGIYLYVHGKINKKKGASWACSLGTVLLLALCYRALFNPVAAKRK